MIAETAERGFVDRLANVQLPDRLGDLALRDRTVKLTGANALGFGVSWRPVTVSPVAPDLRARDHPGDRADRAQGRCRAADHPRRVAPRRSEEIAVRDGLQHCVREGADRSPLASAGLPMTPTT